jgi:hypothetical protein
LRVGSNNLAREVAAIGERYLKFAGLLDHVVIRKYVPGRCDDDTRAETFFALVAWTHLAAPAEELPEERIHHEWIGLLLLGSLNDARHADFDDSR